MPDSEWKDPAATPLTVEGKSLYQLLIELMQQKALQRKLRRNADACTHHGEQSHLGDQQPRPQ